MTPMAVRYGTPEHLALSAPPVRRRDRVAVWGGAAVYLAGAWTLVIWGGSSLLRAVTA